eukprot:506823-Rhodomonas_salina.1
MCIRDRGAAAAAARGAARSADADRGALRRVAGPAQGHEGAAHDVPQVQRAVRGGRQRGRGAPLPLRPHGQLHLQVRPFRLPHAQGALRPARRAPRRARLSPPERQLRLHPRTQ